MRAVHLEKPDTHSPSLTSAPIARPGHVVIKVVAAGLCHSDLAIQQQIEGMPPVKQFPLIPGPEIAGSIYEEGEGSLISKPGTE